MIRKAGAGHWVTRIALVAAMVLAAGIVSGAVAQVSLGAMRQPPATGIVGFILAQQSMFYRELSGLIRAAKTDGSAYWALMGVSFVYGIFHAAGPGHGKAVISSYLLANEETWRRGVALSFASALLQAVIAVALVTIVAVLIGATAKMMGDTARVIELASYGLIVLLGARLLWVKGRGFLRALRTLQTGPELHLATHAERSHHDHDHANQYPNHQHGGHCGHAARHHHDHGHHDNDSVLPWGHAHGLEPQQLAGSGGWRRGLSAIIAVGLRPCSGAIIVLVFALAQGLFYAGVASTFIMGIGTAITVAAIATLAISAKAFAARFAAARPGYGTLLLRGIEAGAALLIMVFGVLLLTGDMASERMGMF